MKRSKTPTFLLELPLRVDAGQGARLRAHLEVARCFYNALLGEAMKRLRQMRSDPAWQKRYGKSVALRAPGMFVAHLTRTVAKTGGTLREVGTSTTKLSQYCHGCQTYVKKPLWQRWHHCSCGVGPVQRDLYSAFLLAYLPSAETIPSIAHDEWEGAEPRLLAAMEP